MTGYSFAKTLWKVVKAAAILGSGAVASATFPDPNADATQWALFLTSLMPPVIEGIRNYQKNKD